MATHKNFLVNHVHIKTALLHGILEYIIQPKGYVKSGEENKVCKLNKAIYSSKQVAKSWNL